MCVCVCVNFRIVARQVPTGTKLLFSKLIPNPFAGNVNLFL